MIEEMHRLWDGKEWQEFAIGLLSIKHAVDGFQHIPDLGGDGGLECWTRSGCAYQCYAAEGRPSSRELAKAQKSKLSTDIEKFYENAEILSGPIREKIKTWILLVPRLANKDVLRFAREKETELRRAVAERKIAYADPEIEVLVHDLSNLQRELKAFTPSSPIPPAYATPWGQRVADSPLWSRLTAGRFDEPLKRAAAALASECWYATTATETDLSNRWADLEAPERVVQALADLVDAANPSPGLNAAEVALAITAPFLRAAAIASAEALAFEATLPLYPQPEGEARTPIQRALRIRWQKQPHITRRVAALRQRGKPAAAEDTARWLLRRAVCGTPEIWRRRSEGGFLDESVADAIGAILADRAAPLGEVKMLKVNPLSFARFVGADEDRLRGAWAGSGSLETTSRLPASLGGSPSDVIRPRLLAALLALAGRQALEPLELGSILVDHIGLSEPLLPSDVVIHAREAAKTWELSASPSRFLLKMACRHPAVDAALCDQVAALDGLRRWLAKTESDWLPRGTEILLPEYVDAISAAPGPSGRDDVLYERQQIRFTTDADQVKELLMGAQLYGDPELAIRELYQNALDACRYRRAREEYLTRTRPGYGGGWEGAIEIEQGIDHDGRPYIECRDNGVGMDEHVLLSCFARAGKRFSDTDEYLEERAAWDSLPDGPIELWPNSRFGIGVFSYFMLADEIRIVTRRFRRDGILGDTLTVSIAGSGSLFRVRRNMDHRDPGTNIRLYLSRMTVTVNGEPKDVSVTRFLNAALVLAEFPVIANHGSARLTWSGGWRPRQDCADGTLLETEVSGLYWWIKDGQIGSPVDNPKFLCDGIFIGSNNFRNLGDLTPVCNLYGANSPTLTADRMKILNVNLRFTTDKINEARCPLAEQPGFSFYTFASLAQQYPFAAERTLEWMLKNNRTVLPLTTRRIRRIEIEHTVDIAVTGICGDDYKLLQEFYELYERNQSYFPNRQEMERRFLRIFNTYFPISRVKEIIGTHNLPTSISVIVGKSNTGDTTFIRPSIYDSIVRKI